MVSRDLIAASTRPLVLAVLAQGENYGYAIIQRIRKLSGGELEWSEGMLYPVLHRMAQENLIIAHWVTSANGKRRKYYRLSASGTRAIEAERRQWFAVHDTLTSLWGAKPCLT